MDIDTVFKKVEEDVREFAEEFGKESFERVVNKTPVNTGFAKGNWNLSLNDPNFDANDNEDPSGTRTLQRNFPNLNNYQIGQTIYISSGVDYVFFLEEGTSDQAPNGMVNPTASIAQTIAENSARRLR